MYAFPIWRLGTRKSYFGDVNLCMHSQSGDWEREKTSCELSSCTLLIGYSF